MTKQTEVTINGVSYDTHTGMRVHINTGSQQPARTAQYRSSPSNAVHKKTLSRTQTLNRAHVKSPIKKTSNLLKQTKPMMQDIAPKRSPMIQKFAPSVHKKVTAAPQRLTHDIAPVTHPIQHKVAERQAVKQQASQTSAPAQQPAPIKPAKDIKHSAIEKALHNSKDSANKKIKKQSFFKRHPRLLNISSASLAVVMLGGYLTYVNLPNISVRVAAAQAGIAATYPTYTPSGYSLNGPVAFADGQVSMKFASNVGPQNYTVKQVKSSWDSSALLENYVAPSSSDSYQTLSDSGLTIYTYGNSAAWVNGGILHTIDGEASLSPDQVRKIATSM